MSPVKLVEPLAQPQTALRWERLIYLRYKMKMTI